MLLGDAATCITLFGEGSSSAISGAETLARSLAAFHRTSLVRCCTTNPTTARLQVADNEWRHSHRTS